MLLFAPNILSVMNSVRKHVPEQYREECIHYLEGFVTPKRSARIKEVLRKRTRHLTVVLENLFQPHNASAVLRSCECFGIQDVHIVENDYAFERTRGVSMGAEKWLTMHHYNEEVFNTQACLRNLKSAGYRLAATTLREGAVPLQEIEMDEPLALMFGTELSGLTETAHQEADLFVYLPMWGFTQSFNISVSCALSLYELRRRLDQATEAHWRLARDESQWLHLEWLVRSIKSSEEMLDSWLQVKHSG